MVQVDSLVLGADTFRLLNPSLFAIFHDSGYMTWHLHLNISQTDTKNYVHNINWEFLLPENEFSPTFLSDRTLTQEEESDEIENHLLFINRDFRWLKSVAFKFGKWDTAEQSIEMLAEGIVKEDTDNGNPALPFKCRALLKFDSIKLYRTSEPETQTFLKKYYPHIADKFSVEYKPMSEDLLLAKMKFNF